MRDPTRVLILVPLKNHINLLVLRVSFLRQFENVKRFRQLSTKVLKRENRLIAIVQILDCHLRHFDTLLLLPTGTIVVYQGEPRSPPVLRAFERLDVGNATLFVLFIH